ncbi:alkylhydroperoxidase [Prauserella sp. PE36]|uniref:Carboxymuconolactone decarboxylase family protein n=1 Tax=Prauserella endophytica TaxID=1592324 RepID=A0ABY2S213_9PSEU|nr:MULTISPECIES: carboxymuconolactone decarboxylase family protein [Prauserella]PXY25118.1 alkylhydroperoxidase [Prauserella coralliicola]RBM23469.1 alkylhydroperoxidase [Prauserella sp. PE36]TKG69198.1 carboxymuconolactone decarboxylase family protein [Prauserella endophytica]
MTKRTQLSPALPEAYKTLVALHTTVEKAAADAGLDQRLIELVKIRASQINGCAFCVDMHSRDARKAGETERRLFLLSTWWETELYTEQERAALALTEAMTRLPQHQDVPDDVYEQAKAVFTEEQYVAVAWAATVINAFNRLGVTSRKPLPPDPR